MKKLILASIVVLTSDFVFAQRFFRGFEVLPYLYTDNVFYGASNWKYVFEAPGRPQSANLDSMSSLRKDGSLDIYYGIQLRMLARLVQFNNPKKTTLEWHFGPGYRSLKNAPADYSNGGKFLDTTRAFVFEKESFALTYHYFDLYSSIILRNTVGPLHGYVGFGLEASIPVGSRQIEEPYSTLTWQWNTVTRRWEQVNQFTAHYSAQAVKTYVYSFTVPAGLSFDVGNHSEFKVGLEYFNARRDPQIGHNYSEGMMLQAGFRYNLQ